MQDAFNDEDAELSSDRFAKLDALLSKADMYTQFVSEQLAAVDEFGAREAVSTANGADHKVGKSLMPHQFAWQAHALPAFPHALVPRR